MNPCLLVMRFALKQPFMSPTTPGASCALLYALLLNATSSRAAETDPFTMHETPPIAGRWDLQVRSGDTTYSSRFAVEQSGYRTLMGIHVGQFDSARPIGEIEYHRETGGAVQRAAGDPSNPRRCGRQRRRRSRIHPDPGRSRTC